MDMQAQSPQAQSSDQSDQNSVGHKSGTTASDQPLVSQQSTQGSKDRSHEETNLSELDRVYIDKAIEAVESNADDPYAQNESINRIRADYLRERFDKQINNEA